ncbi:hypothetical protein GCM10027612_38790 [Microbispora bryophytorum subsp. camponoti]
MQAEAGIETLREEVDTLIVIPNDRLLSISDRQVSVLDAFKAADQVLLSGVQGITDLITTPGLINLDFADVKSVMSGAGSALMGIGHARGDDRSVAAAEMAVSSPLLEASIDGAHGVLLSIAGGSDLGLFEINEAAQLVSNAAAPDANIIFGTVIDDALGDEVRVTVIAAGFDEPEPVKPAAAPLSRPQQARPAPAAPAARPAPAPAKPEPRPEPAQPVRPASGVAQPATPPATQFPVNAFTANPVPPPAQPVSPPVQQATSQAASAPEAQQAEAVTSFPRDAAADGGRDQGATGPLPIPRPAPEPPTPITSRAVQPGPRRPVVFEEQEEELDVPDFLK